MIANLGNLSLPEGELIETLGLARDGPLLLRCWRHCNSLLINSEYRQSQILTLLRPFWAECNPSAQMAL